MSKSVSGSARHHRKNCAILYKSIAVWCEVTVLVLPRGMSKSSVIFLSMLTCDFGVPLFTLNPHQLFSTLQVVLFPIFFYCTKLIIMGSEWKGLIKWLLPTLQFFPVYPRVQLHV